MRQQTQVESENDLLSYRNPAALWCLLNSVSASEVARWRHRNLRKAKPKKALTHTFNHLRFIMLTSNLFILWFQHIILTKLGGWTSWKHSIYCAHFKTEEEKKWFRVVVLLFFVTVMRMRFFFHILLIFLLNVFDRFHEIHPGNSLAFYL